MNGGPRVSIVITSHNYERFLRQAIDSALAQTYAGLEVVVVDDGSTDDSRAIIASYGDRIRPVLQENGGMGSAFNAGLRASRGEIICFLDADDTIFPVTVERAVQLFEPGVAKVHWQLRVVDEAGHWMGSVHPPGRLSEGDLCDRVLQWGEDGYTWPVTSGNAWSRAFLDQVTPIPHEEYRFSAESYLATLAPAFGLVKAIREPLGTYRLHMASLSNRRSITDTLRIRERRQALLQRAFARVGLRADIDAWHPDSAARQQILETCAELEGVIPGGSRFLFVEWEQWGPGQVMAGATAMPFLEQGGRWMGRPADDQAAIDGLERLRQEGAAYIAFASPGRWWLEHYQVFAHYLMTRFACILETERVTVFDLTGTCGPRP